MVFITKDFASFVRSSSQVIILPYFFLFYRRFVYENIPQLKYRNQRTLFNCTMTDDSPAELKIAFGMFDIFPDFVTYHFAAKMSGLTRNILEVVWPVALLVHIRRAMECK